DAQQNQSANMMSILIAQAARRLKCRPVVAVDGPSVMYTGQQATFTAVSVSGYECPNPTWTTYAWQRRPFHPDPQSPWTTYEVDTTDAYVPTETVPNKFDLRALVRTNTNVPDSSSIYTVVVYQPLTVSISG